jgi:hypothetical protein
MRSRSPFSLQLHYTEFALEGQTFVTLTKETALHPTVPTQLPGRDTSGSTPPAPDTTPPADERHDVKENVIGDLDHVHHPSLIFFSLILRPNCFE